MSRLTSFRTLVLIVLAAGCSSTPSGPSTGSLKLTVGGLPTGTAAAISVTGPGGFSQTVSATQTIADLAPGAYTVAASDVIVSGTAYSATPGSQVVSVNGGSTTVGTLILYSAASTNLTISISGLGTNTNADVTVTGPNAYSQAVTASTTLTNLTPGDYTVTAHDVTATGGTTYNATPATQVKTVAAGSGATAIISYAPPGNTGIVDLRIAGLYVTQSVQTYPATVPLVKNRNGFLRVFVVADRLNTAAPQVRVRYFNGGATPFDSVLIQPPSTSVPTAVDQSSLSYTWNVPISGAIIQPGLTIQAEVDPNHLVANESDPSNNIFPISGTQALTIQTVPTLNVTFVPVIQKVLPSRVGVVGSVNSFMDVTKRMHPIDAINTAVHATYTTTTTDTLEADNGNSAWSTILGEIDALRISETSTRYYYGVAKVSYSSGVAGVAYVSTTGTGGVGARAALGWDYQPSGASVAAHELGHNWSRNHAPCGGPTGIDAQYPKADGSIGVYGLDVAAVPVVLEPPSTKDIMGYCDPKWISDYTYKAVMSYLISPSTPITSVVASQAVQPCLLVWGHVRNGEIVLEPAFQVNTRPSLPQQPGPYALEASASDGAQLAAFSFTPYTIADAPGDQQNFAFAVPMPATSASRLARIRVRGRGREAVSLAASARTGSGAQLRAVGLPDSVQVRRAAGGRVAVRWDTLAHPMVMVRDAATGQVLSLARGGSVDLPSSTSEVDLVLSNGVKSETRRVAVRP
jgi:hypothetical protein